MERQNTLADRLIQHYGGRKKAADFLGVSEETLRLWRLNGIATSAWLEIEEKSGGTVTVEEILREAKARRKARLRRRS